MSVELLIQIIGGATGWAIAWAMYYVVDRRDQRIEAELAEQHQREMEAIRKAALKR